MSAVATMQLELKIEKGMMKDSFDEAERRESVSLEQCSHFRIKQ